MQFAYIPMFRKLAFLLSKKVYWDKLYNFSIVASLMNFGYIVSFKNIDRGFIELLGPYGISRTIKN